MAQFRSAKKYLTDIGYEMGYDDYAYTTTTNYIQTNNTTWNNGLTIQAYPSPAPPPAQTQAEKDMAWLKGEVDAICKAAYV